MDRHLKASKYNKNILVLFHGVIVASFTIVVSIGMVHFFFSIIGFFIMILTATSIYAYGLSVIRGLVRRFELTMPNPKATCLHLTNICLFLSICLIATVTELLML